MKNIRQNFVKFILSFCCLVIISACSSGGAGNSKKASGKNPVEVAILVPLSGENEVIGRQYSALIKMGMAAGAKMPIRVTSYDSANEFKLKESIGKILKKKTNIIIGPVYSHETKILSMLLKERPDVTVLSLSNDPTLADNNVFVFGHAPVSQIQQMTNYLMDNEYKNYITLLPTGRHSQTVSTIVQNMITSKGGVVNRMEFYGKGDDDLGKSVKAVSDLVDSLNEQEENLKQPVIIIGDDRGVLSKLYKLVRRFNLDKKALIVGDNRLDIDANPQIDVLYTGSIKVDNNKLRQRIAQGGVSHFSFMHALAYDAGNLVARLVGDGYTPELFLNKLRTVEDFYGLSGKVHFVDSIAKRTYDIIKKYSGEYELQNELPRSLVQDQAE